ncbi:MAG: CoA-transferase [Dehalobacterium sp.]
MSANYYTIDELMAVCMAKTIKDHQVVFNGVAVALPFTSIMLAKKTHAPNSVFWGGLPGGINPQPPFLVPTSGDSVMLENATVKCDLHEVFDMAQKGKLDRIFFGGGQIDQYGNLNNTMIGSPENIKVKLPGGAGASTLACFAKNFTVWCPRHRAVTTKKGKQYTLVAQNDFVTTFGHRTRDGVTRKEMGLKGGGPDCLVTNLGVFDFEPNEYKLRLKSYHPDVTIEEIQENTGFELVIDENCSETPRPTKEQIEIIRIIDPMEVRKREFAAQELERRFYF